MCLDAIHSSFKPVDEMEGYQVVYIKNIMQSKVFHGIYQSSIKKKGVLKNKNKKQRYIYYDTQKYKTGFHFFISLRAAKNFYVHNHFIIVKAKFYNVHTKGLQHGIVYVADKMKIIEEVYVPKIIRNLRIKAGLPPINP